MNPFPDVPLEPGDPVVPLVPEEPEEPDVPPAPEEPDVPLSPDVTTTFQLLPFPASKLGLGDPIGIISSALGVAI